VVPGESSASLSLNKGTKGTKGSKERGDIIRAAVLMDDNERHKPILKKKVEDLVDIALELRRHRQAAPFSLVAGLGGAERLFEG
jgi:hypothetical protein